MLSAYPVYEDLARRLRADSFREKSGEVKDYYLVVLDLIAARKPIVEYLEGNLRRLIVESAMSPLVPGGGGR